MFTYIGRQYNNLWELTDRERVISGAKIQDVDRESAIRENSIDGFWFRGKPNCFSGKYGYVEFNEEGNTLVIKEIIVEPRYLRLTIGSRFLSIVEQIARNKGKTRIVAYVDNENEKAKAFFNNNGYVGQGTFFGCYEFTKQISEDSRLLQEVSQGLEVLV